MHLLLFHKAVAQLQSDRIKAEPNYTSRANHRQCLIESAIRCFIVTLNPPGEVRCLGFKLIYDDFLPVWIQSTFFLLGHLWLILNVQLAALAVHLSKTCTGAFIIFILYEYAKEYIQILEVMLTLAAIFRSNFCAALFFYLKLKSASTF